VLVPVLVLSDSPRTSAVMTSGLSKCPPPG
jgi:hypothetical protein